MNNRIKSEKGVEVETSAPIVVFRESVMKSSDVAEGRSPNKHNSFFLKVEPLEDDVAEAIENGSIPEGRLKKKDKKLVEVLNNKGIDGFMFCISVNMYYFTD